MKGRISIHGFILWLINNNLTLNKTNIGIQRKTNLNYKRLTEINYQNSTINKP